MNPFFWLATANLILGGLVFLLGLLILRENPRQKLNRVVMSMLFFGGLGSILAALTFLGSGTTPTRPVLAQNFAYLWEFFFPTLFLFASIFPRERGFVRKFRGFSFLVYAPHLVHFILYLGASLLGPRLSGSQVHFPDLLRPFAHLIGLFFGLFLAVHRALFSLVNLGYGFASAMLLLDSYRHARVPRLREQIQVVGLGLTACLLLYSVATSLPALFGWVLPDWVRALLIIIALTVGSGSITYAMVRYKFLDMKLLARRGILYAVASAILVGLYLTVITRVSQLMSGLIGMDARVLEPFFLVMALILFQPAMARLEDRLEQVFLQDPGDYRNVLRRMGRDLLTAIDLNEMLSQSIRTIGDALLLRSAHVAAFGREEPILVTGAGEPPPPGSVHTLREILERLPAEVESVRFDEDQDDLSPEDSDFLEATFGAALLLPLRSKGETVGALLLGNKVTGTEITAEELALLSTLAGQMSVSVQNGLLLRERVAGARIEEELHLARSIQSRFLPSSFPRRGRIEVHGINTPSRQVGGDFYDFVPHGDGGFYLAIADVSGKGVPAALLTSMLQASLRTQASSERSVADILGNINRLVSTSTSIEQFATFFLGRVDEATFRMEFSNAGHNHPIVCRKNGERVFLDRGGLLLGMFEDVRYEEGTIDLGPGDRAFFYTDGVTEAMNGDGTEYGEERFCALVESLPIRLSAEQMTRRILDDLYAFLDGDEPQDDVTVMALRVLEDEPAGLDPSHEAIGAEAVSGEGTGASV
jgi:serine phosphatase RsbU (regulator of sigma subunit)